tara:strand:- start:126 stop:1217 length:1092 start_codon:yes stop_codon:yes gene_type:complete
MKIGDEKYGIEIEVKQREVRELLSVTPEDVETNSVLTYAKNVFIPLTTACKYACTYCTYFDPPGKASLLSPTEVKGIVKKGIKLGCTEALFTFGDDPDDRYVEIYRKLNEWGHESIHTYLEEMCEMCLKEGILPHSNPGDQTREQMEKVARVNASMGVMLETVAEVKAHAGIRKKNPGQRLNTLRIAGELKVPFTTGILVGIGETEEDRAKSLLAIREMNERYGHIQEVIIQPVVENIRWRGGTPSLDSMRRAVSMARYCLPPEVSVQVPPNLASIRNFLDCGIDDLGGISPVTIDHINPDYAWPALQELNLIATEMGVSLKERLPIYDRFVKEEGWISSEIKQAIEAKNVPGERYRKILTGV